MFITNLALLAMSAAATGVPVSPSASMAVQQAHEPTITSEIFVAKATMSGLFEVEAGKLALSRSKNPDVRTFADRMVREHIAAGVELSRIVANKTYAIPNAVLLDTDHQKLLKKLEKTSAKDFDAAYGQSMMDGHDEALRAFTLASTETLVDADLRAFASKAIPALQTHRELAHKLPVPKKD